MVKKLKANNFTTFSSCNLDFGTDLNIFVGENSTGKTHLLKLVYSILAVLSYKPGSGDPMTRSRAELQRHLADKLVGVFRPESLGRLTRRKPGRGKAEVTLVLQGRKGVAFSFSTNSSKEVKLTKSNIPQVVQTPAFIPTRELLTLYPDFVSVYEERILSYPETWRDLCLLLGRPLTRGPRFDKVSKLLEPLEKAMGGQVVEKNGRFYLRGRSGNMEMPLVAEGLRKFGMLARLVSAGVLLESGYLFWDEPEANLNPKLVRYLARSIIQLGAAGTQVFLATHSMVLLREIELILAEREFSTLHPRFFGLHNGKDGVEVTQSTSVDEIGAITALEEQLEQSDRYLELGAD